MAHFASSMRLGEYLHEDKCSHEPSRSPRDSHSSQSALRPTFVSKMSRLAVSMKATIGWFYFSSPERSETWAKTWLQPFVIQAHDIIFRDRG